MKSLVEAGNYAGLLLRGTTIASKFLLVIYIGRYLSLSQLGTYGLFAGTSTIAIYVVGLEFHSFSTREIQGLPADQRGGLVQSQLLLHGLAYAMLAPFVTMIFIAKVLPLWCAPWLVIVLVGGHLSLEIHRLLIAISRPFEAYLISTIAHGIWVLPVIAVGLISVRCRTLEVILATWSLACSTAVVVGVIYLRRLGLLGGQHSGSLATIKKGLGSCWIFFIVAVCHRTIELSDRFFIQVFEGESQLGIYTLYGSMTKVLQDLVFAGFLTVVFPKLIAAHKKGDTQAWRLEQRRLVSNTLLATALLIPAFVVAVPIVGRIIDQPSIRSELLTYYILLAASVVFNLSMIPHYILYAWQLDGAVLRAAVVAAILNLMLNALWVPTYGLPGAAAATGVAVVTIGSIEMYYQQKMRGAYEL